MDSRILSDRVMREWMSHPGRLYKVERAKDRTYQSSSLLHVSDDTGTAYVRVLISPTTLEASP